MSDKVVPPRLQVRNHFFDVSRDVHASRQVIPADQRADPVRKAIVDYVSTCKDRRLVPEPRVANMVAQEQWDLGHLELGEPQARAMLGSLQVLLESRKAQAKQRAAAAKHVGGERSVRDE